MSDLVEPRREPQTDEGSAIVDALLTATGLVLDRDGYEALTTNEIARVAGVSIGSLYQYFPNKRALVVGLARRIEARGHALAMERAGSIDPSDARLVTATFVSVMLDPQLGSIATRRALLLEVPPAWILEATRATDGGVESLLVQVIELLGPGLRAAPPDVMAFVAFHAVEGVVEAAMLHDAGLLEDPGFHGELHRLAWSYVAPESADRAPRGPFAPSPPIVDDPAARARLVETPSRRRSEGAPRTAPQTARAEASVERVLAATRSLLSEVGFDSLSARKIAKRAEVSPATLYRYFPDVRAIVVELARRQEAAALIRIANALTRGDDVPSITRAAIEALVADANDVDARHALIAEVPLAYVRDVTSEIDGALRQLVEANLQIPGRDVGQVAFVVAHAVEAVIDAALLTRKSQLGALTDELTTLCLRYLDA